MASARYHPLQFLTYFAAKLLRRGHDAMGENEGSLVLLALAPHPFLCLEHRQSFPSLRTLAPVRPRDALNARRHTIGGQSLSNLI